MKKLIISFQFILFALQCHGLAWQQQQAFAAFHSRPIRPQAVVRNRPEQVVMTSTPDTHAFTLKSIYHHASPYGPIPGLFRALDVPEISANSLPPLEIRTKPGETFRPFSSESIYDLYKYDPIYGRNQFHTTEQVNIDFEWKEGALPDIAHRPTVTALAMMTNNAYSAADNDTDWYDLGAPWNLNSSFGWESDGMRGHVFGNQDGSILIISIKGTSAGLWGGGQTGEKDKMNDNTLFSCCCAYVSRAWTPVCDCFQGNNYICETSCLQKSIGDNALYYDQVMEIYKHVADKYNSSEIWLTGHSLGGALASLVGQTFLVPTVTFEIPGELLAAQRLHLPHGIEMPLWHFGHTADPIFVGVCTGPSSSCWYGGFAMETRCHTGKVCVWDTVNEHKWRVDIRSHRVQDVIENILKQEETFPLPECVPEDASCHDCGLWEFVDKRDPPKSSSSSSTTSSKTVIPEPPTDPWGFV